MLNIESQSHDLFIAVIEKPPSEWHAFLDIHCDSPELRAKVQALLDLHVRSSEFLSKSVEATYPSLVSPHGNQIEEFNIIRPLGKGGMGTVYLAEDTILKRLVALKIVEHASSDESTYERFRREARASARLSNPGIVQVYRNGEGNGFSFIAMEFVEGKTLHEYLEDNKKELTGNDSKRFMEIARLISEVADSLDFAHRASVIHRDVKPSNILVDVQARARLSDFGIARITTEQTLQKTGDIVGSIKYMSPEQANICKSEVDHRTDIFSLGVVLYEAISSKYPFDGTTQLEVFKALADGRPASLRKVCPSVPVDLATICHTAIEHDLSHRYQTAAHMSADLRCFIEGRPILAKPPGIVRRARYWAHLHQRLLLVASICLLVLALMGVSAAYTSVRRAGMGQLVITDKHRGFLVSTTSYTHDLRFEESTSLGRAPLTVYLKPGLYRITIESDNGSFETSSFIEQGAKDVIEINTFIPSNDTKNSFQYFSGGAYQLGDPEVSQGLNASRTVVVSPFHISKTAVSNKEYREFVHATGARSPGCWPYPYDPKQFDNKPVTDISWDEANHYCRWKGVRLPTPNEWERAARGSDGLLFPWGNTPHPRIGRIDRPKIDFEAYSKHARCVNTDLTKQTGDKKRPNAGDKKNEAKLQTLEADTEERLDHEFNTSTGIMHMLSNVQEYTEGIAVTNNRGILLKGRSWADSPFINATSVLVLSSRSTGAFNRGFRVAFTKKKE